MQFSLKYRPHKFADVVGQSVIKRILMNSIIMNRVPTAILLSGLHGCGKTSLARIFAMALNCESLGQDGEPCGECSSCLSAQAGGHPLIIEYDAASHSGVDGARDFHSVTQFSTGGGWRVIILDECHMLSKSAQAAILKLVEEPPKNTVFIFVTTDITRLDATISSRCLNLRLQPLSANEIEINLSKILANEGLTFAPNMVESLARSANGSLRDIQQMLNQFVLSGSELTEENLCFVFGIIPSDVYKDLAHILNAQNFKEFLVTVKKWEESGVDLAQVFTDALPKMLRDFRVCLSGAYSEGVLYYSGISHTALTRNLRLSVEQIQYFTRQWEIDMELLRETPYPRVIWDVYAVSVCNE